MNNYRLIKKLGEGTFSEVFKAQVLKTGVYVAIKCMKNNFSSLDQVNNLREIQALKRLSSHQHIIKLIEVLYDESTGRLSLVFELMEQNLYEAIKGRKNYLTEKKVKMYMYQLFKALDYMHKSGIFHRDIKPENILLKDDYLVLADLGSCKGIYTKPPFTEYISTRWYRAPECLLTDGYYNYKMDLWGAGCVHFEISSLFPLFPGDNEIDQVSKIQNILGTINQDVINLFSKNSSHLEQFGLVKKSGLGISKFLSHMSYDCQDLIMKLLVYNPEERYSAKQALCHPYFKEVVEQETKIPKISLNNFSPRTIMKASFHNESQSIIKSTEDSHNHNYSNKYNKKTYLPEIKTVVNIHDPNFPKSNLDHSDTEIKLNTQLKLPMIAKATNEANYYNMMSTKMNKKITFLNQDSTKNQSIDLLINTQYSKKLNPNNKSVSKKFKTTKKSYVSPYSNKIISSNVKA